MGPRFEHDGPSSPIDPCPQMHRLGEETSVTRGEAPRRFHQTQDPEEEVIHAD